MENSEEQLLNKAGDSVNRGESTDALTPVIAEGPYYKPGSPERTKIVKEGITGTRLTLTGRIYDRMRHPVSRAWIDFWQADGQGIYDNAGFSLRGHQYSDESGNYVLETVVPGAYKNRTSHIHVKVRAGDNSPVLTTQLFFPDMETNKTDFLFREENLIKIGTTADRKLGEFDFIVEGG